ncbi:MAG TPA: ABC transporter permease [Spirochaetia bacterium]|nr:ABC transporter permease [Spirochaetia bacterium]
MSRTARTRLVFFVSLLALWQCLCLLRLWPAYVLPSPLDVAGSVVDGFGSGLFLRAILRSLGRILEGYGISVAVGVPLGLLLGRVKAVQDTLGTVALGLQALPSICWLPLALLWFGLSERAIIFVVIMGALMAVTLATADGVKNLPPIYVRAARTLGASGLFLYRRVMFPAALPAIVSGLKLGWSFAWRSLMAGELLFVTVGLGQLLTMGRELNDMSRVIAVMLLIIALGLGVDRLVFLRIERLIRTRWGTQPHA